MTIRQVRVALTAVAAVSLLAVVAGCSSSSKASGGGASSTSNTASGGGGVIKVGTICSCSGSAADVQGQEGDVMKAWAKAVNAAGGINGHQVQLYTEDDAGDPTKSLQQVKQLVEQDHVIAIVGDASNLDGTWASYLQTKGIPVLGGNPSELTFTTDKNFYPTGTQFQAITFGQVQTVHTLGAKYLGTAYCAEFPICAQTIPLVQKAAGLVGDLKTTSTKFSFSAPNLTPQCVTFKNEGVDSIFPTMIPSQVSIMAKNCADQNYTPLFSLTGVTNSPKLFSNPLLNKSVWISPNANYTDTSIPGVKAYLDALDAYNPGMRTASNFTALGLSVWSGGKLFEVAAKAAKLTPSSGPSDVVKGLNGIKGETLGGISPPLTYTAGQPSVVTCYFADQIENGAYNSLNGGQPTCPSASDAEAMTSYTISNFSQS